MGRQNVSLETIWYEASKQLKAWEVIYAVFLRDLEIHPETFKMEKLINKTKGVGERIHVQA